MSFEQQIVTLQEVERYRATARQMQSAETARLFRLLFRAPARLFARLGRRADMPTSARHA